MTAEKVKSDLRLIKYGRRDIDGMITALEGKKQQLAFLKESKGSPARIESVEAYIKEKEKEIQQRIYELDDLEKRYESAISCLDVIDRLIIREGYLGTKSHAELAELLGYTVRGVEARINRVAEKLAESGLL